jgi:hypothetical protein
LGDWVIEWRVTTVNHCQLFFANCQHYGWLNDWMIGWPAWLVSEQAGWMIGWLGDWVTSYDGKPLPTVFCQLPTLWVIEWLNDWMIEWLDDWMTCLTGVRAGRLGDWVIEWRVTTANHCQLPLCQLPTLRRWAVSDERWVVSGEWWDMSCETKQPKAGRP